MSAITAPQVEIDRAFAGLTSQFAGSTAGMAVPVVPRAARKRRPSKRLFLSVAAVAALVVGSGAAVMFGSSMGGSTPAPSVPGTSFSGNGTIVQPPAGHSLTKPMVQTHQAPTVGSKVARQTGSTVSTRGQVSTGTSARTGTSSSTQTNTGSQTQTNPQTQANPVTQTGSGSGSGTATGTTTASGSGSSSGTTTSTGSGSSSGSTDTSTQPTGSGGTTDQGGTDPAQGGGSCPPGQAPDGAGGCAPPSSGGGE